MRMILGSFYQRMTQSRLSSIFVPCLRKLGALDLISPSLKVCGWVAGLDPPVALNWCPSKFKILGTYVGLGNLEEDNWGPQICAVKKTLLSWRQCNLSFRGKALSQGKALSLSRIWYVASLVHMPLWVLRMPNSLIFDYFWKTKCELVSHAVVVQTPSLSLM